MTTTNNLIDQVGGIEKAKEIVGGAPEGRSFISGKILPADGFDVRHGKYVMCDGVYKFHYTNGWDIHGYAWHDFVLNVVDLNDLRTAIAKHDEDHCNHEWNDMTSNGDKYRSLVCKNCDSTKNYLPLDEDHITDIRNHISPRTVV